jgi:hypothetical protein
MEKHNGATEEGCGKRGRKNQRGFERRVGICHPCMAHGPCHSQQGEGGRWASHRAVDLQYQTHASIPDTNSLYPPAKKMLTSGGFAVTGAFLDSGGR